MVHIAESEWIIMKELWKKSPLTSREIIDAVADSNNWNAKTIHTLIQRLCKKGAVTAKRRKDTSFYNYYPNVSQKECAISETKHFLKKIYSGSLKNLVSTFVEDDSVSRQEIEELKLLLETLEKEKNDDI